MGGDGPCGGGGGEGQWQATSGRAWGGQQPLGPGNANSHAAVPCQRTASSHPQAGCRPAGQGPGQLPQPAASPAPLMTPDDPWLCLHPSAHPAIPARSPTTNTTTCMHTCTHARLPTHARARVRFSSTPPVVSIVRCCREPRHQHDAYERGHVGQLDALRRRLRGRNHDGVAQQQRGVVEAGQHLCVPRNTPCGTCKRSGGGGGGGGGTSGRVGAGAGVACHTQGASRRMSGGESEERQGRASVKGGTWREGCEACSGWAGRLHKGCLPCLAYTAAGSSLQAAGDVMCIPMWVVHEAYRTATVSGPGHNAKRCPAVCPTRRASNTGNARGSLLGVHGAAPPTHRLPGARPRAPWLAVRCIYSPRSQAAATPVCVCTPRFHLSCTNVPARPDVPRLPSCAAQRRLSGQSKLVCYRLCMHAAVGCGPYMQAYQAALSGRPPPPPPVPSGCHPPTHPPGAGERTGPACFGGPSCWGAAPQAGAAERCVAASPCARWSSCAPTRRCCRPCLLARWSSCAPRCRCCRPCRPARSPSCRPPSCRQSTCAPLAGRRWWCTASGGGRVH